MKNVTKLAIAGLACATLAIGAGFTAAEQQGKGKMKGHAKQAMGETVQIGAPAPAFELTDLDGNTHNLQTYLDEGKVIVLEWFNPECPFVVKQYDRTSTMMDTYNYAMDNGDVVWLAINSGAEGKQGHGIEKNKQYHTDWNMKQPILVDESGKVGKMYGAKTTPHMYVIDGSGNLVYAGAIDNNPNPTQAGDTNYVKDALRAVFAGETVATSTSRPYGCSVKYAK